MSVAVVWGATTLDREGAQGVVGRSEEEADDASGAFPDGLAED